MLSEETGLQIRKLLTRYHCSLCCCQLFSHSCSAGLMFLVHSGLLPKDAVTTAWFLKTVNDWFDIMSTRHGRRALYRGSVQKLNKLYEVQ